MLGRKHNTHFGVTNWSSWMLPLLLASLFLNLYFASKDSSNTKVLVQLQQEIVDCSAQLTAVTASMKGRELNTSPRNNDDATAAPQAGEEANEEPQEPRSAGAVQSGGEGVYNGEEGWVFNLERVPSKTDNTVYDPKDDAALVATPNRYARSPVPKGSWKVRVAKDRWVTMDDVAFAYDVWFEENQVFQYTSWLGVYVQQDPSDAFAIQDMLYRVKPDLIIEVGTNTGGGAIFYATIMKAYNPNGKIVTLDVVPEIRNWNKKNAHRCPGCVIATEHPWWNDGMITYINGRVTEQSTRDKVDVFVKNAKKVLVIEDASHRYPDTLQNIESIHQWVSVGSYLLVQDTKMDRFVAGLSKKYGRLKFGPMKSVDQFLEKHSNFVIDRRFEYLLFSQHHRGYLRRVS